ncbi:protease SohB [Spongiibacter sp. KMU-158]|uniref:Protease SohB n=1 Tax=Spongiibacter pelagi TaxID=2760804 RepID=A0A927C5E1_9GAMM|nr:protease SohB [Spongiibacter pelagi]MBD2859886.1 protease SohB [Spongiibacter pelagi]
MSFLAEYGLFLAKSVTVLVVFVVIIGAFISLSQRTRRDNEDGHIEITALHKRFEDWQDLANYSVMTEQQYKDLHKEKKKKEKQEHKSAKAKSKNKEEHSADKKRLYVLDFNGDIKASEVAALRHEITAILTVVRPEDEILLRLESPGGLVHSYGLAASQLQRIRDKNIELTIAIDEVAASGGYMMACTGTRLIAAPFAVIGSIGVIAQLPNVHRLLKKHDIDVELHTAGEFKRTLTMVGENTEAGRKKFVEELEDTHSLFKDFVGHHRPNLNMAEIATGEVWYGQRALDKGLIDALQTSDDYLLSQWPDKEIYQVKFRQKRSLQERLGLAAEAAVERGSWKLLEKFRDSRFFS